MKLLTIICLLFSVHLVADAATNIPRGVDGFSGMVECTVLKKGDSKILVKVNKVHKLWEGNKAQNAEAIIGKSIIVSEGWFKNNETGKWQPNHIHVNFMKNIKEGTEISLEIKTGDGDRFHILELNKEQRALGGHHEEGGREEGQHGENQAEANVPKGARGFSGMVKAKVIAGNENGLAIKIEAVLKTWPNNKAENTEALAGKVVVVKHGWFKNRDSGRWQPNEWHQKYIKLAQPGTVIELEIGNLEGDAFNILELNKEQRTLVGHPHPAGEGD